MPPERGLLAQLMAVQGAICREVRDVRVATRVMAQHDPHDPFWVPVPFDGWPDPGTLKVAVTRESYGYPIHPELLAGIDRAAGYLSDAGYQVEEVTTPSIEAAAKGWFDLLGSELETFMMPMVREHGSATIQQIFEWYFQIGQVANADEYRVGIKERSTMTREWELFLDQYPLVLTPYFMRPTPAWDCDAQSFEETYDVFRAAMYSTGINFVSLPAGVVPIGLVEDLPAGIQVVGRRYREDLILDAIEAIEARAGVLARELWAREG